MKSTVKSDLMYNYKEALTNSLALFQLIEHVLKLYLIEAYSMIKSNVNSYLHFGFNEKDVVDLPLGELIRLFHKFNNNQDLFKKLQGLTKSRNFFAHRGFLYLYGPFSRNQDYVNEKLNELTDAFADIKDIYGDLLEEHQILHEANKHIGIPIQPF